VIFKIFDTFDILVSGGGELTLPQPIEGVRGSPSRLPQENIKGGDVSLRST
jgi:hypothetical protein